MAEADVAAMPLSQAYDQDIPMLLAYGADDSVPGVNSALPRLRRAPATERGQLRLVSHPAGGHGFDVAN